MNQSPVNVSPTDVKDMVDKYKNNIISVAVLFAYGLLFFVEVAVFMNFMKWIYCLVNDDNTFSNGVSGIIFSTFFAFALPIVLNETLFYISKICSPILPIRLVVYFLTIALIMGNYLDFIVLVLIK